MTILARTHIARAIALIAGAAILATAAFAQQGGTAEEAKAMLVKAVAAVKADKNKALDMFNKGEGGFRDRDLYPFCFNISDGKSVAVGNPNAKQLLGQDQRTLKDVTGKAVGLEQFAAAHVKMGVDYRKGFGHTDLVKLRS